MHAVHRRIVTSMRSWLSAIPVPLLALAACAPPRPPAPVVPTGVVAIATAGFEEASVVTGATVCAFGTGVTPPAASRRRIPSKDRGSH
jgi:hypothetical protein